MKINGSAFLAVLLLVILQTCVSGRRITGRVVGGRSAVVGEFPYQVSLQMKYLNKDGARHICGGALMNKMHVLTAGHCVYGRPQDQLRVVAGVLNISDTSEPARMSLRVDEIYLHEGYVHDTLQNDIALIRVRGEFPVNSPLINFIPYRVDHVSPPAMCTVSGWGNTREYRNNYPDILQAVEVPLISQDVCVANYNGSIKPGMFCAGYLKGGMDACDGDSGGPLQCGGFLTGIVSWGDDCALPEYPGVYTDVAYYKDWIRISLYKSFARNTTYGPVIYNITDYTASGLLSIPISEDLGLLEHSEVTKVRVRIERSDFDIELFTKYDEGW